MNAFHDHPWQMGLTYDAYRAAWYERLDQPLAGLDKVARKYLYYARYNRERAERARAAYEVSENLRRALAAVDAPQRWLVLTEAWCGDSAYLLPVIAAAAAQSPLIDLRILHRDEHPDVMDRYLTNGSRSIPKLIAFGEEGEELFTWGPRPEAAEALRQELLAEGVEPRDITSRLNAWYDEGGWRTADGELAERLQATVPERA